MLSINQERIESLWIDWHTFYPGRVLVLVGNCPALKTRPTCESPQNLKLKEIAIHTNLIYIVEAVIYAIRIPFEYGIESKRPLISFLLLTGIDMACDDKSESTAKTFCVSSMVNW